MSMLILGKKEAWPGNKLSNEIVSRFYIEGTVINSIPSLITIMVMAFENDLYNAYSVYY